MDLYQQFISQRYARWIESESRREIWPEPVDRYLGFMCDERLPGKISDSLRSELRDAIVNFHIMPSMRALMTAGPALARDEVAAYNCSGTVVDSVMTFDEAMYLLMCGCGFGFSVERQFVTNLPVVADKLRSSKTIIRVEDSKIGWSNAFRELLGMLYSGRIPEWDLSELRPEGARLKTFGGRSAGPEPLNSLFRFSVDTFREAEGRKLNSLECHDIMCKTGEIVVCGGVRRSAEISLSNPSDDRMRHAKSGNWYQPYPWRSKANNSACYTEKPGMDVFIREWVALFESKAGERGIFNRAASKAQAARNGRRDATRDFIPNPCVTADTWVLTNSGAKQVSDLIGKKSVFVVNGEEYNSETGFFSTGVKKVYRLSTERGYSLRATGDHKILVSTGTGDTEWKTLCSLSHGDRVVVGDNRSRKTPVTQDDFEKGWIVGSVVGDGGFNPDLYATYMRFWGKTGEEVSKMAADMVRRFLCPTSHFKGPTYNHANDCWSVSCVAMDDLCMGLISESDKEILPDLEKKSDSFVSGFLSGFFDADGTVIGDLEKGRSIRLSQSNMARLRAVQRMLARLGIASTIYPFRRMAKNRSLPDGRGGKKDYFCQDNHEICVSREGMLTFSEKVGFIDPEKKSKMNNLISGGKRALYRDSYTTGVVSVVEDGEEEVYDCVVDEIHAFDANGIIVHNCGEIFFRPDGGLCNLTETVVRPGDSLKNVREKVTLATILGTMQATLTNFRYLRPVWQKNAEEERLLGVSMTGVMDNDLFSGRNGKAELNAALEEARDHAIAVNKKWAKEFGINQAAAVTCVKPSGTVSQLCGCASGMHPRYSKFYIRRVGYSNTDPVTKMMVAAGVPHEPNVTNPGDTIFSFPIASPESSVTANDLTAIQQLELYKSYKTHWCEHNASNTIYVGESEWLEVGAWVYKHFDEIIGVTFLPRTGHTYRQAPYEEINEDTFKKLAAAMPSVDFTKLRDWEKEDATTSSHELACSGGQCDL